MRDDLFSTVKASVTLMALLESEGIHVQIGKLIPCPFHSEAKPSFTIYADGHGHCFGCGWHGDVIDAAIGLNGHGLATPFQAAVWLAEKFGVAFDDSVEARKQREVQQKRTQTLTEYARRCHDALTDADKEGLRLRGFDDDAINRFVFGRHDRDACPLKTFKAFSSGYIIPFFQYDQCVYMVLWRPDRPKGDDAKYIKPSRESLGAQPFIASRGDRLQSGIDVSEFHVVEGAFDFFSMVVAGYSVIGLLGTAWQNVADRLRTMSPIICFDADPPGRQKARELARELYPAGKTLDLSTALDEGQKDINDVFHAHGAAGLREKLARCHRRDALELTLADGDTSDADKAQEAVALIAKVDSAIKRDELMGKVKDATGIRMGALRDDLEKAMLSDADDAHAPGASGKKADGLIEDEHGYLKRGHTKEGEVTDRLSNFSIQVRERITLEDGNEVLSVDLRIDGEPAASLELPHKSLLATRDLLTSLGTSRAWWLGSDRDVQLLRAHLVQQKTIARKGIETLGRHGEHIVLPGLVIDKKGPVDDPPLRLVDLHGRDLFRHVPSAWPSSEDHLSAGRAVYKFLPQVNYSGVIVPAIAWVFDLPFASEIRKTPGWGGFPHLALWGGSGAGKTETCRLLWRLTGVAALCDPSSLPKTRFTRLNSLSASNLIPVFYDEFRVSTCGRDLGAIYHELRASYGGEVEARGMPNLAVKSYNLVAPVMMAGEDRPRDAALDQRFIFLNLSPTDVAKDLHTNAFRKLHRAPLEAFAVPYWKWALAETDWLNRLEESRERVRDLQWLPKGVPTRIVNNIALIDFGWGLFSRYGKTLGLAPSETIGGDLTEALAVALDAVMPGGKAHDGLAGVVTLISAMVVNGRLQHGLDFTTTAEGMVVIPLRDILPEARRYARETNNAEDLLGEDAYRALISAAVGNSGEHYVKESTRAGDFRKRGSDERVRRRGFVVDPEALEAQLGIEASIWSGEPVPTSWNNR